MKIRKAIITAAGKNQRTLPLQTLVDRDGSTKSVLAILTDELISAGIEEIAVVICPGDAAAYTTAAGSHISQMQFIEQPQPLGYGHAVFCAHTFTGTEPFLLMVGDHLYISKNETSCSRQLVETALSENCSVSAVQATHESKLPFYGCVGGQRIANRKRLYEIEMVIEKPTPTEAEQKLIVPGLRTGNYLCFFGMHALSATLMELLGQQLADPQHNSPANLSLALSNLARHERYLAHELQGRRYDIDRRYGLLNAQLALGLAGKDRDEVLTQLVELLAQSHSAA